MMRGITRLRIYKDKKVEELWQYHVIDYLMPEKIFVVRTTPKKQKLWWCVHNAGVANFPIAFVNHAGLMAGAL